MTINYDTQTDSIYFILSSSVPFESEEIEKGVIVDYDKEDKIVAIEVMDFKERHQSIEVPLDGNFNLKKAG